MRVVASIAPLADFARQVGGEKVEVMLLLPPGASPHTYEPSPKTMREISRAKIFFKIGAGLEFWADRFIAAAGKNVLTVTCSDGIELLTGEGDSHSREMHADPHIWLDPVIAMKIVSRIAGALSGVDPQNAPYYRKNAATYLARLTALDSEISGRVKTFRTREYVTFHPAWNYFSRRYGLRIAGVIEEGPGKEPTQKHLMKILKELKRMKSPVVFAEPQFSPKIAEVIAKEAGGRVLFLDPVGGQRGRETYIELMKYNISVMEKAMK